MEKDQEINALDLESDLEKALVDELARRESVDVPVDVEQSKPVSVKLFKTVSVRGELEILFTPSLTSDERDVYVPGELLVSVTKGNETVEGLVALSGNQVRRLLKLLHLDEL